MPNDLNVLMNHLKASTKQNKYIQTQLQKMLAATVSVMQKHKNKTTNSIFPSSFGLRNFLDFPDSVSSFIFAAFC